MLAFEVSVNGIQLCLAGTESNEVVSTIISWTRRVPDAINFHIGGIASGDSQKQFDWLTPHISIGDEITIRLVETETSDEPDQTRPRGPRRTDSDDEIAT